MKKHHQYKVHVMTTMCAREVFPVVDERKKGRSTKMQVAQGHVRVCALEQAAFVYYIHALQPVM